MDSPKNNKNESNIVNILFYLILVLIILFVLTNLYKKKHCENFDTTIPTTLPPPPPPSTIPTTPITGAISGTVDSGITGNINAQTTDQIRNAIESNQNNPLKTNNNSKVKKIIDINNQNDIDNIMVGSTFKLRVNIPLMPNYIKGEMFDLNKGKEPNYFYLCVQKMVPNCSISADNNTCYDVYIDDPTKCKIKALSEQLASNSYRLVLVSEFYLNLADIELGKNSDFTLLKIGEKYYLKNVQTGLMPTLFKNQDLKYIYGEVNNNANSNISNVFKSIYNKTCFIDSTGKFIPFKDKVESEEKILTINKPGCLYNPDPKTYLVTSQDITMTSPINIVVNKDKTISIVISEFNFYGQPKQSYFLSKYNIDVKDKTNKGIGQVNNPEPIGPIFTNLVRLNNGSNSRLNFSVEMVK